jgi:hypothetical protein
LAALVQLAQPVREETLVTQAIPVQVAEVVQQAQPAREEILAILAILDAQVAQVVQELLEQPGREEPLAPWGSVVRQEQLDKPDRRVTQETPVQRAHKVRPTLAEQVQREPPAKLVTLETLVQLEELAQ